MAFVGARLNLGHIHKRLPVPKISLTRVDGKMFCFEIEVWVEGEDSPPNPEDDNAQADTARDFWLTPTDLFNGKHSVTLASQPGEKTATLTFQTIINGKIPGTPDFIQPHNKS